MAKNLVYDIHDKPTFSKLLVFVFQQLLAIMAATIAVPAIVGNGMSASAALFGAAVKDVFSYGPTNDNGAFIMTGNIWISFICAIVTLVVVILCSTYGKKMTKLIPFIIGILAGYFVAMIFTVIGYVAGIDTLKIIDFSVFQALVADGVNINTFVSPFVAFLDSIPGCVMGGVCITLYGFIAVSGLKMIQKVDLEDNANLFTVSVILIAGIGGMSMAIGKVTITSIACALILGIIVNVLLNKFKKTNKADESSKGDEQ